MFRKLSIDELIEEIKQYKFKKLHVHHTWRPDHSDFTGVNHIALQTNMRRYHMEHLGWSDIGQHVTLFPDGVFLTGRSFLKTPASIRNHNTGAFAVEMLGNFDLGNDVLKGLQLDGILKLMLYFIDTYGEGSIVFHNELSVKTCPGTSLVKSKMITQAKGIKQSIKSNENNRENTICIGDIVAIKSTCKKYATGQLIPKWAFNKKYRVKQVSKDKVLLDGILSWLFIKDVEEVTENDGKIQVHSKVAVLDTADVYATGQKIPKFVKSNVYEVIRLSGDKALLGGILSWVYIKDLKTV